MSSVFSKIQLDPLQVPPGTLVVLSPLDGQLQSPDDQWPLAHSGLLPDQLQLLLQGNQLRAPFNGLYQRSDNSGSLISFRHSSGLQLDVVFAAHCCSSTEGYRYLLPSKAPVTSGQLIAELDLARLQRLGKVSCLLSIAPADAVKAIYSRTGFVRAGQDPWCWLELHPPTS